ncbi:MAG: ATP-binding protein [Firmicutes bacterium]|nr:ATP-binding protein [Bacillota bacterium]
MAIFRVAPPPFARQTAVEHWFPAAPLVECRARIAAVFEDPGVLVLTGASGVGKSIVLRAALSPLNPTHYAGCDRATPPSRPVTNGPKFCRAGSAAGRKPVS